MSNTINENITRRILHEQLMKLVCEEETPVSTESNGTWIYGSIHIDSKWHRILLHTSEDYNTLEFVSDIFKPFSKERIKSIDIMFDIDELIIMDKSEIEGNALGSWHNIPENIGNTLISEMKKWNEDTLKRNKIKNIFKTSLESVGRRVLYRLPQKL